MRAIPVDMEKLLTTIRKRIQFKDRPGIGYLARMFGVTRDTMRSKLRSLEAEGKIFREKGQIYLTGETVPAPKPKARVFSTNTLEETNRRKAAGGMKGAQGMKHRSFPKSGMPGAERLKQISQETGVDRWTPGMSTSEGALQARIEKIVREADAKGTLYHQRPVYVVLVGEKVS